MRATRGVFLAPSMAERLARAQAGTDGAGGLSAREREVVVLLGEGRTLIEIADHLNVSYRTSAIVTAQIRAKLNIPSTAALIKWAVDRRPRMPSVEVPDRNAARGSYPTR